MAFPVLASSTTAAGSGGVVSPAKPASLAVGDLMIGWACQQNNTSATMSPPSGSWTLIRSDSANTGGIFIGSTYWKVADSADVAAASFAFTGNAGSSGGHTAAILMRITGYGTTFVSNGNSNTPGSGAITTTGVTPGIASLLIILTGGQGTTTRTISGQAVANNNPAWTEIQDFAGDFMYLSAAWGNYNAATATGNSTATWSGGVDYYATQLISVPPPPVITSSFLVFM